ncbi:MAG: hypothetical protein AAFV53_36690 [Myxococcota bacterium]
MPGIFLSQRRFGVLSLCLLSALACGGLIDNKPKGGTTTSYVPGSNDADQYTLPPENLNGGADCDTRTPTPLPQGCVSARLACGDTVQGNNSFGEAHFDDEFYVHNFCTPQRHDYDEAAEIKYLIDVPGDKKAVITLTSGCGDLDVSAMAWDNPRTCPRAAARRLNECEMNPSSTGEDVVTVTTVTNPQTYLIAVDGKNGDEGNYTLKVECIDYR